MNKGTGVYLIPASQKNFPLAPQFVKYLAADNITVQYTDNSYLVDPQPINFAPRIGAAYKLTNKSVIRAGYGIFYGGQEDIGLGLNLANDAPFFVNASFVPIEAGDGVLMDSFSALPRPFRASAKEFVRRPLLQRVLRGSPNLKPQLYPG